MLTHFSPLCACGRRRSPEGCSPVHAAGITPNRMHRFLRPDVQEVLFVS
jgi:hypothetical protein